MDIVKTFRNYGLRYCAHRAYQIAFHFPIKGFARYEHLVKNRRGLEIGGPSQVFAKGGLLPIYEKVGSLDNCNFSSRTIWSEHHRGDTFTYAEGKPPGHQYVTEGMDLAEVADGSYDFILSSHMLEHTANPIRALRAWHRVLRSDGALVLLVPDRRWTFDHRRPVTPFAHLIEDFERSRGEDDMTHIPEILALHDMRRDPGAQSQEAFKQRCADNFATRSMHHHVFDMPLVKEVLGYAGFTVTSLRTSFKEHIIATATRVVGSAASSRQ